METTQAATTATEPAGDPMAAFPADPRPLFATSARLAITTINGVTDDQRDSRTPCAAFDVAGLLDHLAMVAPRITSLGRGEPDFSATDGGTAGWLVTEIATRFRAQISQAQAAWADPRSLDRLITMPWATLPGAAVLTMYTSELTVHTWDLARATHQRPEWDRTVVEASLTFMHVALPADIRGDADDGEVPFAPVIATAADAEPIDQLVAWCGRNPGWAWA
jgi:uncharacterized protein (TIGR03086 family)